MRFIDLLMILKEVENHWVCRHIISFAQRGIDLRIGFCDSGIHVCLMQLINKDLDIQSVVHYYE